MCFRTCINILIILLLGYPITIIDAQNVLPPMSKAEREVREANEAYDRAIVSRDVKAYESILADNFVSTSFDGTVNDKAGEIDKVKNRDLKFEYGKSDDVRVSLYGNTAVVTGRFTARGFSSGKPFSFVERYTGVFVKQNGKWWLVAEHSSEVRANK